MGNGKHRRQRVTKTSVAGTQKNTLKREPLIVALQLRFIDPEGIIRPFPKNFEVEARYGANQKTEKLKIDNDEGKVIFPLIRDDANKYKFLRLHFVSGTNNYIVCEKKGDSPSQIVCDKAKAEEKGKAGSRFFRLPSQWSLLTSQWVISADEKIYNKAEKEKKFLLTEANQPQSIGSRENPIKTLVNPNWQYLKFEFFDRFYGHSDHANKPISILPITVEGFYKAKTDLAKPDVRSNWTMLQDGDEKKRLQCLPWFLQATADGTPEAKPDKDSSLHFKQPKDTFIYSKSATERESKVMTRPIADPTAAADFKPCANRLKYYDLPELWKSTKYWCRLSDDKAEQGFFEKIADKKTMMQKPLIFSLDDMILTDNTIAPLAVRETDRLVVFYHEFLDAVADANKRGDGGRTGATYLKNGLYKPGPDLVKAKKDASDEAKAKEKAKLEKEARETAIATQKKKEEDDAADAAEQLALLRGDTLTKITEARSVAIANVATDLAAQQRITDAGDLAATNVSTDPIATTKIDTAGDNAAILADAPLQAKNKALAKQTAIEEALLRKTAEDTQRNIETTTDLAAQTRIKSAGDTGVLGLGTDVPAQTRITNTGKAAETAAMEFPFSDIPRHEEVPNYISDYPHWSRLVIFGGNLFDVFDKRTATGNVIGARAAVRLVDATSTGIGVAAGVVLTPRPAAIPVTAEQNEAYFILQPYYEQKSFMRSYNGTAPQNRPENFYDEWNAPIAEGEGRVSKIGRNSVALVRTSNYKDTHEENVIFLYHPLSFDFTTKASNLNPTVSPPDIADQRIKWLATFTQTCADRWNGNDAVNTSRAWIVEDKTTDPKIRSQVVTFIQSVDKPKAHIHIETVAEDKTSFVNSHFGTGEFRVIAGADTVDRGFAAAHELGHAAGQPDDYANNVNGQTGFGSNNTSGAPYILDTQAMMFYNRQLRARSFWYLAEWLRSLSPFTATNFRVEHGGFTYKVPHYNHADRTGRNYAHWNVKANIFHRPGTPRYYDSHLYFLGHDDYSRVVLPSQPDGIIVIMMKMLFELEGYTNQKAIIDHIFTRINQKINTALNTTRVHAQFNLAGINRGGTNTFEKCMLHFSPRFEVLGRVLNSVSGETVQDTMPAHLKIKIKAPPAAPAATVLPVAPPSPNNYYYDAAGTPTGPNNLAGLYGLIRAGTIMPETQVHNGTAWDEANNYPALKTLFDVYYWYDDGGNWSTPKTLLELYNLAKAGTINWETDVVGPGWVAAQHADKFADLLPALERWFYEDGGSDYGPFSEMEMHDKFNSGDVEDDTNVTGEPTDNTWDDAKDWAELEAKFTQNTRPRKIDFRFPIYPATLGALNPAVTHLENVVLRDFCKMLGLSVKTTDLNYYGNADAYKNLVKACVNDNTLNPTMSR